jgi:hypothetical protein
MTRRRALLRSWSAGAALATLAIAPSAALGQGEATAPVQVQVAAVGPDGVAGIALLTASGDGTAVQVLVVGAPPGTTAVVHPGDCATPDPSLVALIGDVGASGQVQALVPVPFASLSDGRHVIAFHPGLDMATFVGCGAIPAVAIEVPVASASPAVPAVSLTTATLPPAAPSIEPIPTLPPPPTAAPATPDPTCAGIADWVAGTEARLTRIGEALSDLNAIAGRYDLNGYLSGLASLEGELSVMAAQQAEGPVPAAVGEVNAVAIATYGTFADAARRIYESLTTSVDVGSYSRAMTRYDEATKLMADVQRTMGELKGRCGVG